MPTPISPPYPRHLPILDPAWPDNTFAASLTKHPQHRCAAPSATVHTNLLPIDLSGQAIYRRPLSQPSPTSCSPTAGRKTAYPCQQHDPNLLRSRRTVPQRSSCCVRKGGCLDTIMHAQPCMHKRLQHQTHTHGHACWRSRCKRLTKYRHCWATDGCSTLKPQQRHTQPLCMPWLEHVAPCMQPQRGRLALGKQCADAERTLPCLRRLGGVGPEQQPNGRVHQHDVRAGT